MENSELLDLKMKSSEAYKRSMFVAPPSLSPCGKDTSNDGGSGNFVGTALSSRACASTVFKTLCFHFIPLLWVIVFVFVLAGGKVQAPFTASQLQEFHRQSIICKYIMASMPVPPQLLPPLPTHPSPPQSNSLDLKFSSGSDPEPWRCKRTDGKKWRCSRDVAPEQKYCERHAHKSKPRSRKPVEIHTTNNNRHPPPPKSNSNHHSFHFPTVQLSADQTRCIEWLGRADRSGTIPHQQLMQSSSGMGFNNDQNTRNSPAFQVQDEYPMNFNQYMSNSTSGDDSLQGRGTTRDLMDAWPKDRLRDGITNNGSFTSLTLSMSGWNRGMDDDNEHTIVMLDSETSGDEVLRSQWLNPVSWMSSTAPGGPLGEALCLGNASSLPSPHGYSNSTATSFGSCENALDFIG